MFLRESRGGEHQQDDGGAQEHAGTLAEIGAKVGRRARHCERSEAI
jgi:hypothetical protein